MNPAGIGAISLITTPPIMNPSNEASASSRSGQVQRRGDVSLQNTPDAANQRELVGLWARWRDQAPSGAGDQRDIAFERLTDCLDRSASTLDLSALHLSALPERLPEHIQELDVSRNALRALPTLPNCLRVLKASENRLANLGEPLHATLRRLAIDANDLKKLPASWPDDLIILEVAHNELTALPETLPHGLRLLNVSGNQLTALPESLPADLQYLYAPVNQLTRLPETLPALLRELIVGGNRLTHLPQMLPPYLRHLHVRSNQLTALPESVLRMSLGSYLDIEDNPLPQAVLQRLRPFLEMQGDRPTMMTQGAASEARREVAGPPLSQVVAPYAAQRLELVELWTRWRDQAPSSAGEQRGIAVERLYDCVQRGTAELDLSELDLSALPERLPEHIEMLDVSRNALHALPTLPDGLIELNAWNNRLAGLPDPLPSALKHLLVSVNRLTALPTRWPDGLHRLLVEGNRLAALPETLPRSLRLLNASHNRLTALPESLPAKLRYLNVTANQLSGLPATLPARLQRLIICDNRLTALPDAVLRMSPRSHVDIQDNPLPQAVLQRLRDFLETQGDRPTITIQGAAPEARREVASPPSSQVVAPYAALRLELVQLWARWRDGAPSGTGEQRDVAFERLSDSLERGVSTLDLSALNLSTLPERLSEHIQTLDVSRNALHALPTLPDGLIELGASNNRLTRLPDPLPTALQKLDIRANHLTALPTRWPHHLTRMWVSENRLAALPESLPANLQYLNASANQLSGLPATLPARLQFLIMRYNRLTALPDAVLRMSPHSTVNVENNPLPHAVVQRLRHFVETQGDRSIRILFSASEAPHEVAVRPLSRVVAQWLPDDTAASSLQTWTGIEAETHAAAFAAFLQRLTDTRGARESLGFHARVSRWLAQLADAPRLREQTFVLAQDATASCEDRVALTHNAMQVAALLHRVEDGQFDRRLPALLAAGREMFRLDALESIARAKAATLRLVDEIEVYLAYQTGLGKSLELSTAGDTMRYENLSGVTPEDLKRALADVQARENRDLADWLAAWAPWRKAIERVAPDCFDKVERDYNEAMDVGFQRRVSEELSARQLADCPDAEAAIGKSVADAFRKQRDDALTRAFLLDRFVMRTSGGTPLTHLDRIEELVEIAVTAPAIAAMAISVRNSDGQHIGSRIADGVTSGGGSVVAFVYLSTLRLLFIDGHLDAEVVIDLLLPRRHDDGPKSIARAVAGAASQSQAASQSPAALTLRLLLGELGTTADGGHSKLDARMSLPHANDAFGIQTQPARANVIERVEHAERHAAVAAAVAHLRGPARVAPAQGVQRRPSHGPTRPFAPDRDQQSLLNRINGIIRPFLLATLPNPAVARSQPASAHAASRRDPA